MIKQNIDWHKDEYLNQNWQSLKTSHYNFHFLKNSDAERDIKLISTNKEKHHQTISNWLGIINARKINYYLYNSIKEKNELMGDDSPGNAIWQELDLGSNPFSKKFEIHVIYNEKCKFIGEHEDTHLLSLPWGLSIYLFCEGLAQYMENSFIGKDLHVISKKLLSENKLYPLKNLCDNENWETVEPIIIYPQAGSFIKFLIERYGKEKLIEVYKKTSRNFDLIQNLLEIHNTYTKTINELENEWLCLLTSSL